MASLLVIPTIIQQKSTTWILKITILLMSINIINTSWQSLQAVGWNVNSSSKK